MSEAIHASIDYVSKTIAAAVVEEATRAKAAEETISTETTEALRSKADLVNGRVPASQLPAAVDEIIEKSSYGDFVIPGEESKIYLALDTNKMYRWSGSQYVEVSQSLALGTTPSTAFPGNRGAALERAVDVHSAAIKEIAGALETKANKKDIPDLSGYATEKYVDEVVKKADGGGSAVVEFNQIVPETTDTEVVLKPVDGKANWVADKVNVKGRVEITGCSIHLKYVSFYYYRDDKEHVLRVKNVLFERCELTNYYFDKWEEDEEGWYYIEECAFRTLSNTECYTEDGDYFGTIPEGVELDIQREGNMYDYDGWEGGENKVGEFYFDYFSVPFSKIELGDSFKDYDFDWMDSGMITLTQEGNIIPDKSTIVLLPDSTESTKTRRFTLAVETDVDTEKVVAWQNCEVVEAVPGASKLVPGLTVWDVSEVAPGKFKVERASSPAQSVPLTLTASNGRVAELAVNDDLVLEVKEK